MPRAKAIAIAAIQENPFIPAFESAKNCAHLLTDLMYGTPERTRLTYIFAIALFLLGVSMNVNDVNASQVCAI